MPAAKHGVGIIFLFILPLFTVPAAAATLTWSFYGPHAVTEGPQAIWAGRVGSIAVDPRDKNTAYLGAVQGGVWKTTDGGNTWTPLTDNQPTLAIGSLALDPSNPDIVYAATGEETFTPSNPPAFGGAMYGAGVLKSTDRGATWKLNSGPFAGPFGPSFFDGGARIGSLAVNPTNGQVLLAAADFHNPAKSGIYRSADGGVTWMQTLAGASGTEALFDPAASNVAYAALGDPFGDVFNVGNPRNGVYKSTDGGATWVPVLSVGSGLPTNAGRIRLSIAASNSSTLYAGIQKVSNSGATALGIWKTTDGGKTWTQLANAPEYCRDSCFYHNVIRVSPTNPNTVVVAGLVPYRSLDGGASWKDIGDYTTPGSFIHGDIHALFWSSDGSRLYMGTDGGAYSTDDLTDSPNIWNNLNRTLAIAQYYQGISIHPIDSTITLAGAQDNGAQLSGSPFWQVVDCGDGGRTLIDPTNPSTMYVNCPIGNISKSTNGGTIFTSANAGIQMERASFYQPFTMDPNNSKRLYYGSYRVYVTNDGATSWTPISPDLTRVGKISGITTITVAPSDSNTVYTAAGNDAVQPRVSISTNVLRGTAATWTDISAGLPSRPPSQIAVDRANPQIAYISFTGFSGFNGDTAGHVFSTSNGGATWTDISGNLPNTEVNDLVLDPDLPATIYAATDSGVWWTLDGGKHWTQLGAGLPAAQVTALAMHRPSRTLRAATYGRSMWDLHIPIPSPSIAAGGVVNAAFPVVGAPLAPGSIATLYGQSLSLDTIATPAPWPPTLAGATIKINASTAAIYYAAAGQINFQVPWENTGSTAGALTISTGGVQAPAANIKIASVAPGLFTTNQQGSGQAAALVAGTAIIAAPQGMFPGSRPIKRGEYLELYGTGLGPVSNVPPTGAPAPVSPLASTIATTTVTIGGVASTALFSGLSPNYVGLYQIDVLVPNNAPVGSNIPVSLSISGVASNTVTVAIQ